MARAGLRFTIIGLAAAGLLTGCVEGGGNAGGGSAGFAAAPGGKKAGTRDVEAPEVFQATDKALWDGRPSLGGIWVAAPDVTNPERALIVNQATGKSVTGALFRRERENPGPRLQLSSDAAEALGILAGQPTDVRVIALRKEEVKTAAAAAPVAPATAATGAEAKPGDAKPGEAAAIASAALAAVDAGKPASGKPASASATAPAASGAPAAEAAVAGAAVAAVDEPPKRKTWKERRAEAKAEREAKKRAAAEAKAAASAAEADAALAAGEGAAAAAAPTATAATVAVAPIEAAPLDARKPEAVAAKPEAAGTRKVVGAAATPAAKPAAPAAAAAAAAPVVASGPVRPIQVASFSKEDNAKRAAEALAKIGITATPQKSEKGEQAVWGVVVQGDEAVLKKIKAAGFADAYFLK